MATAAEIRDACDTAIAALVADKTASRMVAGRSWTALELDRLREVRAHYLIGLVS